jgi:hypothetical protein
MNRIPGGHPLTLAEVVAVAIEICDRQKSAARNVQPNLVT